MAERTLLGSKLQIVVIATIQDEILKALDEADNDRVRALKLLQKKRKPTLDWKS